MIPIIDLTALRQNPHDPQLAHSLDNALVKIGFCYLINHGIDLDLIARTEAIARTFFAQPEAYKRTYDIAKAPRHSGYVPFSEMGLYADESTRMYEAFDLGPELPATDPDFLAGNIFYGPNTWPDLATFRETVSTYFSAVRDLADRLATTIEYILGLDPGAITQLMQKPTAQLRLIHYPENQLTGLDPVSHTNMGAHTDYEFFTLLYQTLPGLQTLTVDGEWIDAPPLPGTLVLNVGDLAEIVSGGRFRSNPHRVLNTYHDRFSMPYFAAFNYDVQVAPMVPTTRQFAPISAGKHLLDQVTRDFTYLRRRLTGTTSETHLPEENPFFVQKFTCRN